MNHGKCINCWWYCPIKGHHYIQSKTGLSEKLGYGKCYMHNGGNDFDLDFSFVDGESYCPDYINRTQGNREQKTTLYNWIVSMTNKK